MPVWTHQLQIVGAYAYIASFWDGFNIVDIRDPLNPIVVGSISGMSPVEDVAVENDRAYVLWANRGLVVFDVSAPSAPRELATYSIQGVDVVVDGGRAAVIRGHDISVLNVTEPTNIKLVGEYNSGKVEDVVISGEHLFVADGANGLVILEIHEPHELGSITCTTPTITVEAWDHGAIDGDRVDIIHNGMLILHDLLLTGGAQSLTLDLQSGANTVDIRALNEGTISPNTAAFRVRDGNGVELLNSSWEMFTGEVGRLIVLYVP